MINYANPYATDPSQQTGYSMVQDDGMSALDKGWFKCYKIAICLYLISAFAMVITLFNSLQYVSGTGTPEGIIYFSMIVYCIPILFIIIQLIAIQQRDFVKAKMALVGHFGFYVIQLLNATIFNIMFYGELNPAFLFQSLISVFSFTFWVLLGSMEVYKFLKAKQEGTEYKGITGA